jgi:hypothetical protein
VGEQRVAEREQAVDEQIERAVEAALAGPYPDPAVSVAREYAP